VIIENDIKVSMIRQSLGNEQIFNTRLLLVE